MEVSMSDKKGLQNIICGFIIAFCAIDMWVKSLIFEESLIAKIFFLLIDVVFLCFSLLCLLSENRKKIFLALIVINSMLILYNFFLNLYFIFWVSNMRMGISVLEKITKIFDLPLLFIMVLNIYTYHQMNKQTE
jgi:hypothetical protein